MKDTSTTRRGGSAMETKLARITEIAKEKQEEKFTSLVHLINRDMLTDCHRQLEGRKASGVDEVTKRQYSKNLEDNIEDLLKRMKRHAYKPQPVRRVYIEKPGTTKMRPLGIPAYEDKLVQLALSKILNAIYEADFHDSSFGFRPGRGSHDALKVLNHIIERRNVNFIVDADIKGFFDHVDHEWLMKFLRHRIVDPNILRLIVRFLKAGAMEAGMIYDTPEGTPQGGVISPILANVYLHYVLDCWFEKAVRSNCRGEAYIVRYADDFVCCFQYEDEAWRFHEALNIRLNKFNLEIAQDKTRIISFGRNAVDICRSNGSNKPSTFDFLGFTHYCSTSRAGMFRVKRKTSRKKLRNSLMRCKLWLTANLTTPSKEVMRSLRKKLSGYYRYYSITDNLLSVDIFRHKVRNLLFKWFYRRSQRRAFCWDKFIRFLNIYPLPRPKVFVNIYDVNPAFLNYLL